MRVLGKKLQRGGRPTPPPLRLFRVNAFDFTLP